MLKYEQGVEGTLSGYVSKQPELKTTGEGKPVTDLLMCLNGKAVKKDGEVVEGEGGRPLRSKVWYKIPLYDGYAEAVCESVKKNDFLIIPGYQKVTGWMGDDEVQRNNLEWVFTRSRGELAVVKGGVPVPIAPKKA